MSKRTIEIDDDLDEIVEQTIEEIRDLLLEYCKENNPEELPCINNDLDYSGRVHEIIDGSVPIYTSEIEGLWFLYKNEFEQAYENAGFGNNPLENNGMVAIYCYIEEKVQEWYRNEAETIFNEWREQNDKETT